MANSSDQVTKAFDLSEYAVRSTSGGIDVQATHLKFTQDLAGYIASEKTDNEVIAKAVEKAFRDREVKTLGMNAILHYAMENLEVDPANFNTIRDRVAQFVRTNSKSYKVSKGKGGGVQWLQSESNAPSAAAPSSGSMRPRQSQHT